MPGIINQYEDLFKNDTNLSKFSSYPNSSEFCYVAEIEVNDFSNFNSVFPSDASSDEESHTLEKACLYEQILKQKKFLEAQFYPCEKNSQSSGQIYEISPSPTNSETPWDVDLAMSSSDCLSCRILEQECSSCRESMPSIPFQESKYNETIISFCSSDEEMEQSVGFSILTSESSSPISSESSDWKTEEWNTSEISSAKRARVTLTVPVPIRNKDKPKQYVASSKIVSRNLLSSNAPMSLGKKSADVHKQMERERRRSLRDSMDRLRNTLVLPSDCVEVGVLAAAIACVRELQAEDERTLKQLQQLREIYHKY